MKILSAFQQPARDDSCYVVVEGGVSDFACYRSNALTGHDPIEIARHGDKLTEREFRATLGAWDYEADGLHYRR